MNVQAFHAATMELVWMESTLTDANVVMGSVDNSAKQVSDYLNISWSLVNQKHHSRNGNDLIAISTNITQLGFIDYCKGIP